MPINQHHYIIKGVVVNQQVGLNVFNRWGRGNLVNIKVIEYWPRNAVMNETITIMNDEGDCSINFIQDSTYLIGAWNANRYLGTSQCEGTALFSKYKHLVGQLGEPGNPKTGNRDSTQTEQNIEQSLSYNLIWIFAFGLSFLLNIILIMKRKKAVRNSS